MATDGYDTWDYHSLLSLYHERIKSGYIQGKRIDKYLAAVSKAEGYTRGVAGYSEGMLRQLHSNFDSNVNPDDGFRYDTLPDKWCPPGYSGDYTQQGKGKTMDTGNYEGWRYAHLLEYYRKRVKNGDISAEWIDKYLTTVNKAEEFMRDVVLYRYGMLQRLHINIDNNVNLDDGFMYDRFPDRWCPPAAPRKTNIVNPPLDAVSAPEGSKQPGWNVPSEALSGNYEMVVRLNWRIEELEAINRGLKKQLATRLSDSWEHLPDPSEYGILAKQKATEAPIDRALRAGSRQNIGLMTGRE
jgi:hypothetical protein